MSEHDYIKGSKAAYISMMQICIKEIGGNFKFRAELLAERQEAISVLRDICEEFGDNDWVDDLHLADIIEKHLGRNLFENQTQYKNNAMFGVIVDGPDDIHGAMPEIEALRRANKINKCFVAECAMHGIENTPMRVATVEPWSEIENPDAL